MEVPFARQMGNKQAYALKLQEHLYDQLLSQSEFCDITLEFGDVVSIIMSTMYD